MKRTTKILYLVLGTLCLLVAIIGLFVPVLPTTPFLLLASYLFARSSQRLNAWLLSNRLFGEYIRRHRLGLGVSLRHKVITISLLWLTIGYSAWAVDPWWLKLLLVVIAAGVTIHLARMKTYRPGTSDQEAAVENRSMEAPDQL